MIGGKIENCLERGFVNLQLLKIKLKRCKEELDSLRENMHSSKRTFSQRILSQLINSDREKYISYLNGREVMNWMAINTDPKLSLNT